MHAMIQPFSCGPFATNAYVVACPSTRDALIVDPAPDSAGLLLAYLEQHGLKCQRILLTHSHWDHIADVGALKQQHPFKVHVHALDRPNLEKPGSDGLSLGYDLEGIAPDILIEEGDTIDIGDMHFQVLHTPGHSPGSVCFYEPRYHVLLSGDTLFKGTIGNLSFPTSQPNLMWQSLAKLAKLPAHTRVYPGHGPATSIGAESWLPHAEQLFG